jgi:hypothetical protein
MDRNLVVYPHQINLGEEATTRKLVGVIMYVTDGKAVWNGSSIPCSIVSIGMPTVVLKHDM